MYDDTFNESPYARRIRRSTNIVLGWFTAGTLLDAVMVGADVYGAVNSPTWNQPLLPPSTFDERLMMFILAILFLFVITYITGIVLFCRWIHRISKTTHAFYLGRLQHSPGWAVGWWFIPVANWWKPYQVINELGRANDPRRYNGLLSEARSGNLGIYWTLWLATGILANINSRMAMSPESSIVDASTWFSVIVLFLEFGLLWAVFHLMHWLAERHIAKLKQPDIFMAKCPNCGYDLRGCRSDTCPECGEPARTPNEWRQPDVYAEPMLSLD